jgi:hypothetical protein
MKMITKFLRLLMVVVLSLAFVTGNAQKSRVSPLSNKAPQSVTQTNQLDVVKTAEQSDVVKAKSKTIVTVQPELTTTNVGSASTTGDEQPVYNAMKTTGAGYVEKPVSNKLYDPSKYPVPDQGGETVATALVVDPASLPYTDAGTTLGYVNDYDEACTYTGSLSPDVCYSYSPTVDEALDIDLCYSSYDTKVYVYENAVTPGAPYACNDDYYFAAPCYVYSSAILGLPVYAGNTYYIIIDGYGSDAGAYSMTLTSGIIVPPPYNDECDAAVVQTLLDGIPATYTGNNVGATQSTTIFTMPEVWEAFTLTDVATVVLDYCGSGAGTPWGDLWLNLATDCPVTTITAGALYEATTCGDGNYTLTWTGLAAGTYYYPVMLDPAYNSVGDYVIHVVATYTGPCIVDCPVGALIEGEGTIPDEGADTYNGGCNSTPNIWGSIAPGDTYCGTANTYLVGGGQTRDTDWYRFDGTTYGAGTWDFTFTAQAEFDLLIFIIKTNGGLCTGQTFWSATAIPCGTATVSVVGQPNDIFDFWVGPSVFTGYPPSGAPYDYTATLTGTFTPYPTYDCNWTVELWDAYGDGWNGGLLDVVVDGFTYLNDVTLGSGYGPATYAFGTNEGSVLDFYWTAGSWPEENYYKVYDSYGVLVFQTPGGFGGPPPALVTLTGTCVPPLCPPPSALGATNITSSSADLTWTSPGGLSNIEFGLSGFAPTGVPTYYGVTSPYNVATLAMATYYDFYVQDDCGVNGTSMWVGPYTFTTLCDITCPGGALPEGEADIPDEGTDFTNGGCNSSPFVFTPINVGDTYCGRANTYLFGGSNYRDTDWYRLDLTGSGNFWDLTWTVTAGFPLYIFMIDAGSEDCADYVILNSISGGNCVTTSISAFGLEPKVYWVLAMPSVFDGVPPSEYVATLTGTPLGMPIANITPPSFTVQVDPAASTTDVLNIGNIGTYGLNYTADVIYPAKATATCYPQNIDYWTGSTTSAAKTQVSQINIFAGSEQAWAQFDVSSIPVGATITSVSVSWYINTNNCPYQFINALSVDPVTADAATLYAAITGGALYTNYSICPPNGWNTVVLGGNANADLAAALGSGKFGVSFYEYEASTYYWTADGWAEVNKPYITVEYSLIPFWLTLDGAQSISGSVAPGGNYPATVGFNSTGLAVGTYTADIVITTNEPGAKASYIRPVNFLVGYSVYGNVYYGTTGATKPMATNTTVTLNPVGTTVPTGVDGAYLIRPVASGAYDLTGATTKAGGGLQAFDATLVARYLGSIVAFTDLQKRAADVNLSNTVTSFDGTLLKRKLGGIATPQWIAPVYVFDGPFPGAPVLSGLPITVAGASVSQELRTLCSGDLNSSFTPPAE